MNSDNEEGEGVLTLSAQNIPNLKKLAGLYRRALENKKAIQLHNFCYTANTAKEMLNVRAALCIKDKKEAMEKLRNLETIDFEAVKETDRYISDLGSKSRPSIAMVFPGQGSQYMDMAKKLYLNNPVFKKAFDQCDS
ncbi:unnamed protein product, partial [marine sediment metagenome]